jgi:hypothetical protein
MKRIEVLIPKVVFGLFPSPLGWDEVGSRVGDELGSGRAIIVASITVENTAAGGVSRSISVEGRTHLRWR